MAGNQWVTGQQAVQQFNNKLSSYRNPKRRMLIQWTFWINLKCLKPVKHHPDRGLMAIYGGTVIRGVIYNPCKWPYLWGLKPHL